MKIYQWLSGGAAFPQTGGHGARALRECQQSETPNASAALVAVAVLAAVGAPAPTPAHEASLCEARLTMEVSPSVPRAADDAFLSSLLNSHFTYRLDLLRQDSSSMLEVELTGPGPDYRCESVIEAMRKDARVQSIEVESG